MLHVLQQKLILIAAFSMFYFIILMHHACIQHFLICFPHKLKTYDMWNNPIPQFGCPLLGVKGPYNSSIFRMPKCRSAMENVIQTWTLPLPLFVEIYKLYIHPHLDYPLVLSLTSQQLMESIDHIQYRVVLMGRNRIKW